MKTALKTMMIGVAACAFAAPAFAYTLTGTIPAFSTPTKPPNTGAVLVNLQKPIATEYVKLTITAPQALSLGIGYTVRVCVGPNLNSCPLAVAVPPGGRQVVLYYLATDFKYYGIWLGQGTAAAVPYIIDVEYTN
jgi:hypothetical protein